MTKFMFAMMAAGFLVLLLSSRRADRIAQKESLEKEIKMFEQGKAEGYAKGQKEGYKKGYERGKRDGSYLTENGELPLWITDDVKLKEVYNKGFKDGKSDNDNDNASHGDCDISNSSDSGY